MSLYKNSLISIFYSIAIILLVSCEGMPGADARKYPPNPDERVKKNLEEGRGFRLDNAFKNRNKGGDFMFASSNELWRASLDIIDFMPLSSVNYSGGIIITDWYSDKNNQNESIKISIRFLTNEIRSDALDIKIFTRKCKNNLMNCSVIETNKVLITELKKEILKKAVMYEKDRVETKKKPYKNFDLE